MSWFWVCLLAPIRSVIRLIFFQEVGCVQGLVLIRFIRWSFYWFVKMKSKPEGLVRPQAGGERSVTPAMWHDLRKPRMGGRMENDGIINSYDSNLLIGYVRICSWTRVNCGLKFGNVRYLSYFCTEKHLSHDERTQYRFPWLRGWAIGLS